MKSWSYSRLKQYELCPHTQTLREQRAPKLDKPKNRGTELHELLEEWFKTDDDVPKLFKKVETRLLEMRDQSREVEAEFGFNEEWSVVPYDEAFLRAKIDWLCFPEPEIVIIRDFKTGKSWGNEVNHIQQLQFYACCAMMKHKEVQTFNVGDLYVDEGKETNFTWDLPKVERFFVNFTERSNRMFNDDLRLAKPSRSRCRFCDWGPSNGSGACEYGVPWEQNS